MDLPTHFTLNNGIEIPAIGLGTFQGPEGNSKVKAIVKRALALGYRHIDGANAYGNEEEIGQGIKESGIPRDEIFVTSKLAQTWHEPADVERALHVTLKDLQLDYVDLYLMHCTVAQHIGGINAESYANLTRLDPHAYKADENNATIRHPSGNGKIPETWQAMEKLVDSGKARAIGISNFNILKTKRILEVARIIPAVNQVEIHPYLPQLELVEFSVKHGILIQAHSPLGGRPMSVVRGHPDVPWPTEDPKIKEIAATCNMTSAQVCLAWAVQKGLPVVPKAAQEVHMRQNLQLSKLPEDCFTAVDRLSVARGGPVRFSDPANHIGFDIFDEEKDQPVGNSAPWD